MRTTIYVCASLLVVSLAGWAQETPDKVNVPLSDPSRPARVHASLMNGGITVTGYNGKEVIVHRKGATPAGVGVLGVIPGSMATPGFVVRGRGNAPSLNSASHGAGRTMSRTAAKEKFRWSHVKPTLEAAGVTLLSAGIDEVPGSYKDIHTVMEAQADLV